MRPYQRRFISSSLVLLLSLLALPLCAPSGVQGAGASIYWGAMVQGAAPTTTNMQPGGLFDTFEQRANKKMSIIHWGQPWMRKGRYQSFPKTLFENVRQHGSIPMLNWGSWDLGKGAHQPDFQLRDLYTGKHDKYIQQWARAAKAWGKPFFLRFNHEMNGWWYPWGEGTSTSGAIVNDNRPGDFVKAWRHVHDIFTRVGATNATWVWSPNQIGNVDQYAAVSTLYPGTTYVDWTGLSVFNQYESWLGLHPLLTGSAGQTWLKDSYHEVVTAAPNKPMMLAEWATNEAGDGGAKKAAWIKDALLTQVPTNFPKIKAVVWFNWNSDPRQTFVIESSRAAQQGFAEAISAAAYAANQFGTLRTSPIPALSK